MRRLFWLGVGVAAGVALSRKATEKTRQATPAGFAANLSDAIRELGGALGEFGAEVRAGMSEREELLHQEVERRSGIATRGIAVGDTRSAAPAARSGRHRARGADG
ncbi:hypothetical protein EV191_11479 [Tamaricihabitans halophyticus]|uniref:Secreted protein n=1 Tax=Tamaricihabitans halophyticus TaxID=1262583 RepID=A0A4R2QBD1_9PSEU|nr:hypothetical protein [Tamaricihabitans halophyticus]TCP46282.1 hypothetical protein EV191_11479 [Tamaricihabitans halophyticus]